jgi:hypothetical protein
VTKLYSKYILSSIRSQRSSQQSTQTTDDQSVCLISQETQDSSPSAQPSTPLFSPPLCVVLGDRAPTTGRTLTIRLWQRANSDLTESISGVSTNDDSTDPISLPVSTPDEPPPSTQASPQILDPKQDNCSAIARHLFSHVKNLQFQTKAEVADWCRSHIGISIIWKSNTISLMKTATLKNCRLCGVERMAIRRHFGSANIINLKSELCGECSCKTRFLRFARSG